MATQETPQDTEDKDARIKELTEENELLFEQLHVVQEELEKYYHKLKDCEQRKGSGADAGSSVVVIPPQASEALAENLKLRALVAQQQAALQVESTNSLAARLGEMLLKGVSSAGSLIALPVRLRRMWKALDQTVPPAALGGKSFQKVLDAHAAGGNEAVEKLLDSVFLSPVMRANAYTTLARQAQKATEASRTEAMQLQVTMAKLKQAAEESKKQQEASTAQLNKQREEHKQELARLNSQLTELKKAADQARQDAARAREAQAALQRQMDAQKKESDALALRTALMLKNMLTQFEPDTAVLSRVMRIVMGATVNKQA